MITSAAVRAYRQRCEAEARAAAEIGDYDVWNRAIGKVAALDYALCDEEDLAPAGVRIPFPLACPEA
jgi:hypothetical protein